MDKESENIQNHRESFSIKPFYDMVHMNVDIQPTYFMTNVYSSSPKDGQKGESTAPNASPLALGVGQVFKITLAGSYAKYLFTLRLPRQVGVLLPSYDAIATFICNGQNYKVKYFGGRKLKMFGSGWRQFVKQHHLVEGDRLEFQVKENSHKRLMLDVNIIRCSVSITSQEKGREADEQPVNV